MRRVILGIVLLGFPLVAGCLITDSIHVPHGGQTGGPQWQQINPPPTSDVQMTYDSTPYSFFAYASDTDGGTPDDQLLYQWILDGETLNAPTTGLTTKQLRGNAIGPGAHSLAVVVHDTDQNPNGYDHVIWTLNVQ